MLYLVYQEKKINQKALKDFLSKNKDLKTDIPYKDFKGPF